MPTFRYDIVYRAWRDGALREIHETDFDEMDHNVLMRQLTMAIAEDRRTLLRVYKEASPGVWRCIYDEGGLGD